MGVEIIYEDRDIIVVNKPIGYSVQESASENILNLVEELKFLIKERDSKPGNVFLAIVHRLDTNVGGLIVFAKNSKSAGKLSEQIRNKNFVKNYILVTDRSLRSEFGNLKDFLEKDVQELKAIVVPGDSYNAELNYKLLDNKSNLFLYEVELITGKFHQIRVQFGSRKSPILGDLKYGSEVRLDRKIALFAYSLDFKHPREDKQMNFRIYPGVTDYPWNAFATSLKSA